jgi:hypothetical protein
VTEAIKATVPQLGSTGRHIVRGLLMALLIGFVGLVAGLVPAVFIQSVFVGSAQRCEELRAYEEAAFDEVRTDCDQDLAEVPMWMPTAIIAGGAVMGAAGGFGFGLVNPKRRKREEELPWLPF